VEPPESIGIGNRNRTINSPNCGMLRARVARKMPIDVVAI